MKLILLTSVIIFLTIFSSEVTTKKLPRYIKFCKRHDPELSKCVLNSIESLRGKFKRGIPALKLRGMEPFMISEMEIKPPGSSVTIKVKNVKVYGGSGFKFNSLEILPNITELNFNLTFPDLKIKGLYSARGKVLKSNVAGEGELSGDLNDFGATFHVKFKTGGDHIVIDKVTMKVQVGKGKVNLDKLKIDGKAGKKVNEMINTNFERIVTELLPPLEKSFTQKFAETLKTVVRIVPFKELFPEK